MKLSQLSLADYNQLDSIPVINQDLSASGFTPVANTYYRHTGVTNDTFTQGVIYLYDTAYHKLGESGGTTLNKYTVNFANGTWDSTKYALFFNIIKDAKILDYVHVGFTVSGTVFRCNCIKQEYNNLQLVSTTQINNGIIFIGLIAPSTTGITYVNGMTIGPENGIKQFPSATLGSADIVYWNDTEITA